MSSILVILAFVAALIATILGFGWLVDADSDPHVLGWVSLSLTLFFASLIARDRAL